MIKFLIFILMPIIATFAGINFGFYFETYDDLINLFEHLSSGIMLGILSTEFISKIITLTNLQYQIFTLFGLIVGGFIALYLRKYFRSLHQSDPNIKDVGFISSMMIDTFIHSFILGIIITMKGIESRINIILALIIGINIAIIATTAAIVLKNKGMSRDTGFYLSLDLSVIIMIGGILGYIISTKVNNPLIYKFIIGFATTSLLWTVTEEILRNAHKYHRDTIMSSSFLLIGFIMIIILYWMFE